MTDLTNVLIKNINKKLKEPNISNISIYTGKLSKILKNKLKEHFKVTPEHFGYTNFKKYN